MKQGQCSQTKRKIQQTFWSSIDPFHTWFAILIEKKIKIIMTYFDLELISKQSLLIKCIQNNF